jgi:hypothetical protein
MLSLAHSFLFVHIPKTGGNSIQRAFLPFSEDRMVLMTAHDDGVHRFGIRSPTLEMHKHLSLAEYHARLDDNQFNCLFKFCVIRNPWDRCVSHFFSPHRGAVEWSEEAFEKFIKEHVLPADRYVRLADDDADPFDNLDTVLRFERLEQDFKRVCNQLGIASEPLPKVNSGNRDDYQKYYHKTNLVDLVEKKFRLEIDRFGYRFDK